MVNFFVFLGSQACFSAPMTESTDQTTDEKMNEASGKDKPDWARLAGHALDLWQAHLSSLAADPKAKEDMARLIAPMSQAFADWTVMMQQGMESFASCASAAQPKAQPSHEEPVSSEPSVSPAAGGSATESVHAESVEPPAEPELSCGLGAEPAPVMVGEPEQIAKSAEHPEPAANAEGTRGRPASADGPRDLAQLAGRLAELERELDMLRAKSRRRGEGDHPPDGDVQRVAGSGSSATSP